MLFFNLPAINSPKAGGRKFTPAIVVVVLFVMALGTAGCGRAQSSAATGNSDVRMTLVSQPNPPEVGQGKVIVMLADSGGNPLSGAHVKIEGNMNHAGMVPVFSEASGGDGGRYEAPMNWTMGGDWTVDVKVTLADGRTAARQFALTVSGGH